MHYTQLFRTLREAKGLTLEELARMSRKHRNTIVNVESGRPVKFKTISELMVKMGYGGDSNEMRSIALLWLESVTGLSFSHAEIEATRRTIGHHRSASRQALKRLEDAILRANLTADQINVLLTAVRYPAMVSILETVRDVSIELASDNAKSELKVAEDK